MYPVTSVSQLIHFGLPVFNFEANLLSTSVCIRALCQNIAKDLKILKCIDLYDFQIAVSFLIKMINPSIVRVAFLLSILVAVKV